MGAFVRNWVDFSNLPRATYPRWSLFGCKDEEEKDNVIAQDIPRMEEYYHFMGKTLLSFFFESNHLLWPCEKFLCERTPSPSCIGDDIGEGWLSDDGLEAKTLRNMQFTAQFCPSSHMYSFVPDLRGWFSIMELNLEINPHRKLHRIFFSNGKIGGFPSDFALHD